MQIDESGDGGRAGRLHYQPASALTELGISVINCATEFLDLTSR